MSFEIKIGKYTITRDLVKTKVFYLFLAFINVVILGFSLLSIAGCFGDPAQPYGVYCDFACHFRPQYLIILLPSLLALFLLNRQPHWFVTVLAGIAIAINTVEVLPLFTPSKLQQEVQNQGTLEQLRKLRILLSNVNYMNGNHQILIAYIQKYNPDMIAITELTPDWHNGLKLALREYRYQIYLADKGTGGLGLYSRIPLDNGHLLGQLSRPNIVTKTKDKYEPITFVLTHPYIEAPVRDPQLEIISQARPTMTPNLVLLGDLNTTCFSQGFKRLQKSMDLVDVTYGMGWTPTWPCTHHLLLNIFLITIDHCLISKNLVPLKFEVLSGIGSDHYPVIIEIGQKVK
jgi:endonuclease/exonuclease/phosphatase (EEP) superfamily protein YafD